MLVVQIKIHHSWKFKSSISSDLRLKKLNNELPKVIGEIEEFNVRNSEELVPSPTMHQVYPLYLRSHHIKCRYQMYCGLR